MKMYNSIVSGGVLPLFGALLALAVDPSPSAANLVDNGGFETLPPFSGWTEADASSGSSLQVVTGGQSGNMADFAAYGGADDMISQILATTPNSSYTFSFWLNTQDGFSGSFLTAKWDGTTVLTISPSDPEFGWTQFSFTEKATGSDTISFAGQNGPGGIYLDTVNVTPVPDGGLTFAMLGTAMTGLALARRKF